MGIAALACEQIACNMADFQAKNLREFLHAAFLHANLHVLLWWPILLVTTTPRLLEFLYNSKWQEPIN